MAAPPPLDAPASSWLARIEPPVREGLLARSDRRRLSAGDELIRLGGIVEHLFVVDSGLLKAEVPDRNGTPVVVARHGPGDVCGEMSFLRGERAAAHVAAVTDSVVWAIPHQTLGAAAQDHPSILGALGSLVAERLSQANLRVQEPRGAYARGCVTAPGSAWALRFLVAVGRRAAELMQRPVLIVDLDADATPPGGVAAAPSLSDIAAAPDCLTAFAPEPVDVRYTSRGDQDLTDLGWLIHTLVHLRQRHGLVLVRGNEATLGAAPMTAELDDPVVLWEEGRPDPARDALRQAATFFLRESARPQTQGELAAMSRVRDGPVILAVPGGPDAVAGDAGTIDWAARHCIKRKVGLALGAGGSKGYAHFGVVRELQAHRVPIDYVTGASVGAPIAAGLAAGWELDAIRAQFGRISARAVQPTLPRTSLLRASRLRREIEALAQGKEFEELELPLALIAVDLDRREEVVLRQGDVADAIVASFAIPGIYPPVARDGRQLVDGGLLNPVPIATAAALGADVVIGVKLTNPVDQSHARPRRRRILRAPPIVDTIVQAFEVMEWKIATDGAAQADVLIEPRFTGSTGLRDFDRGDDFAEAGRSATVAALGQIRELLPWIGAGHA